MDISSLIGVVGTGSTNATLMFQIPPSYYCCGSMVTPKHLLTAAHCFQVPMNISSVRNAAFATIVVSLHSTWQKSHLSGGTRVSRRSSKNV